MRPPSSIRAHGRVFFSLPEWARRTHTSRQNACNYARRHPQLTYSFTFGGHVRRYVELPRSTK